MAGNKVTGFGPDKAATGHLEGWLCDHQESILERWLEGGAADALVGGVANDAVEVSNLGRGLLSALCDRSAAQQLLATLGPATASSASRLSLSTWHTLSQALRQSIVAELRASTSAEQGFELLLAADEGFSELTAQLNRLFEQQLGRLADRGDHYKSLFTVAHEIATSLELNRVAQRALDGAIQTTGADAGVLLILDRESGQLVSWASVDWELDRVRPESLPKDWMQGWRDEPIPPIKDISTLTAARWQEPLQVPPSVSGMIIAPIVANGEFYGLLVLGSRQADCFTTEDMNIVGAITTQVAGVSENAEIYRLINRQAQQLGDMLRHQQEEASKIQAILESIADGVVVNNHQGQVIVLNPAAERILNEPRDELIAADVRQLVEVFDEPGRSTALAAIEYMLSQASSPSEINVLSSTLETGKRVIHAHMAPVVARHDEFLGVVTILRDVTKEVEADRAKSEFISTVSHELRTPMTAIKGYTDLLSGGAIGPLNDNQKYFLSIIKNNTDRLVALINDLLDISRIEMGRVRFEPIPIQVADIIAEVVETMAARAQERGLTLSYEIDTDLPEIMGDRGRLYQVVTNLVGNAINYTPEGGIRVEATNTETAVQVRVRDTGVGIAPEDIGHIFDRFYRADDPHVQQISGTGLGLPLVKMFVEMHGGRVWVDSEQGKGSAFTFILPASGAELEPRESGPPALTRPPIAAKTVLVVDDDPDIAQLVRMQLEGSGYQVRTASRGERAMEIVNEDRIDLVVLDRLLPDVNGLMILDELKGNPATARIPVVMLTVIEDDGEAMARGASAYLVKPTNEQQLLEQVSTVLRDWSVGWIEP